MALLLAVGGPSPTTPPEMAPAPSDPAAVLPLAIPGFERTAGGLNGPIAGLGGRRTAAARTFLAMGPEPRSALVVVVTRAEDDHDAAALLAGARSGSSIRLPSPPGAAETGATQVTFKRGVWVATVTVSSPRDARLLVPAALAEASRLPAPTALDIQPIGESRQPGGQPSNAALAAAIGASALVVAVVFLVGLAVVRRRARPHRARAAIPRPLPPRSQR